MKKTILTLFVQLIFLNSYSQSTNTIEIGVKDSVQSKILKETRKIWVHIPASFQPGKKYPVIYLLDGDAHFYSVVGMMHHSSVVNSAWPEMIVVGIPNNNRTLDLTPYKAIPDGPFFPPQMIDNSGGGENFISFLKTELIPYIEANYPTAPYRTLVGHSFGGLLAIYTLLNHTDLFNAYIAVEPSVAWAKSKLLNDFKTMLPAKSFKDRTLFIGIANTLEDGMELETAKKDTTGFSDHIRNIFEIDDLLKTNTAKGLSYSSRYYPSKDHNGSPLQTTYDGFDFIFNYYNYQLSGKDFMDPETDLAGTLARHYQHISSKIKYEIKPPEDLINGIGYQLMGMQQLKKAFGLFEMNVKNFPKSQNVYDSMGDYYMAVNNKEKAAEFFKKALAIKEVPGIRKKLGQILDK